MRLRHASVLLAVALSATAMMQLPVAKGAAGTQPEKSPLDFAPPAPDLTRCRPNIYRQMDHCLDILDDYGREVARRASRARAGFSVLPRSAQADAVMDKCPTPAFAGAVCGHVDVPLDRGDSGSGKIPIAFELYEHTGPGDAKSAILMNWGGPGGGTIPGGRGIAFYLFGRNLRSHDLLLIDDRGRGLSDPINCPHLQGAVGTIQEQVDQCALILGDAADNYGSGDVAKDTEDVRAALGYDLVDYYGVSYGGADVTAYATRFPEHIRSLILDAPWGDTRIREELVSATALVQPTVNVIRRLCWRSPTCDRERRYPARQFSWLVKRVRRHPVVGNGYTADGRRRHLRVNPKFIIEYLMVGGTSVYNREIVAAAAALRKGDRAPLLRLAAEAYYPLCCLDRPAPGTPPVRFFSSGSYVSTFCVDNEWEWNWESSIPERRREHAAALADAPAGGFLPFTHGEATSSTFVSTPYCIRWPEPEGASPIAPPNADYPDVPTFVLGGDLDNQVPFRQTGWIAAKFPGSRVVKFVSSDHGAAFSGPCALRLVSGFIRTLAVGDSGCARRPQGVYPAVGEFPVRARQATPAKADPGHGNESGLTKRRVAGVVAASVRDAVERAQLAYAGPGSAITHGLRGGRVVFRYGGSFGYNWVIRLRGFRFTRDVVLDGVVRWPPDASLNARLRVQGAATGEMSVRAGAYPFGRMLKVRGALDGERVAVVVPQV